MTGSAGESPNDNNRYSPNDMLALDNELDAPSLRWGVACQSAKELKARYNWELYEQIASKYRSTPFATLLDKANDASNESDDGPVRHWRLLQQGIARPRVYLAKSYLLLSVVLLAVLGVLLAICALTVSVASNIVAALDSGLIDADEL